jgi:hypothetical protein
MSERPVRQPMTNGEREILWQIEKLFARWLDTVSMGLQTASEHCLRLCGMKPTVLDQRNPLDLHMLALSLQGPTPMHYTALGAGQADVSRTRSSSLRTRVKDVVTRAGTSRFGWLGTSRVRMEYETAGQQRRGMSRGGEWVPDGGAPTGLALVD